MEPDYDGATWLSAARKSLRMPASAPAIRISKACPKEGLIPLRFKKNIMVLGCFFVCLLYTFLDFEEPRFVYVISRVGVKDLILQGCRLDEVSGNNCILSFSILHTAHSSRYKRHSGRLFQGRVFKIC